RRPVAEDAHQGRERSSLVVAFRLGHLVDLALGVAVASGQHGVATSATAFCKYRATAALGEDSADSARGGGRRDAAAGLAKTTRRRHAGLRASRGPAALAEGGRASPRRPCGRR